MLRVPYSHLFNRTGREAYYPVLFMNQLICGRMAVRIGLLLILWCIALNGNAQTLNLYDAVNKAVANYPLLQQRQAEVNAGRAHIKTVNGNRLPSLMLQDQLDAGTSNALQGTYLSLGMVPSTPGGSATAAPNYNPNPVNVAISSLQWEFFNFGYYNAQRRQAGAQLAVNEANLSSDKYLLTESMISVYLDWLKKYRLLQIQEENMQRAQVILTSIRATVLSGLKPGVDSSTASAVYADARMAYLQALDDYNYDRITLQSYTGINAGEIVPDTSFIGVAMPQLLVLGQPKTTVATGHPLLNVYEKQYEEQLAGNDAIARRYLPRAGVIGAAWERSSGVSYAGAYPDNITDGLPYSKFNYLLGVTLTYNLFDLRHRHDEVVEGRYQAQAKQSALQNQQVALDKMMQQANASYATTVEKLKELPVQLYSARQAYGQQMALYKAGLNTLIEVTNAQYVLLQAESSYVLTQDALLQLLYIRAGLSGQLDDFLQNFKR